MQKKSFAKRLESTSKDKGSILAPFLFLIFLLNCSLWFLCALIIEMQWDLGSIKVQNNIFITLVQKMERFGENLHLIIWAVIQKERTN